MPLINPETISEGWTQSELSELDNCGFKWKLRYDHRLRRKGSFSWALVFGTAFHKAMENIYRNKGKNWKVPSLSLPSDTTLTGEQEEEKEYWQLLLGEMLHAYVEKYSTDFDAVRYEPCDIERVADLVVDFCGTPIRLKGMLDLFAKFGGTKGSFIWDHKTCGKLSMTNTVGWEFRFQFMFYVWLNNKIHGPKSTDGFMVNAVKKTELRQKKGESISVFMTRVADDMRLRPEMYFYRDIMKVGKDRLEQFEQHTLYPKLMKVAMLQRNDISDEVKTSIVLNRNTNHCIAYNSVCEFLPICRNGYDMEAFQYEQRTAKHTELEESE